MAWVASRFTSVGWGLGIIIKFPSECVGPTYVCIVFQALIFFVVDLPVDCLFVGVGLDKDAVQELDRFVFIG